MFDELLPWAMENQINGPIYLMENPNMGNGILPLNTPCLGNCPLPYLITRR
jgi:hypothetical protein